MSDKFVEDGSGLIFEIQGQYGLIELKWFTPGDKGHIEDSGPDQATNAKVILESYGMYPIGNIRIIADSFIVSITDDEIVEKQRTIYAFLLGNEIVRVGSSKARLQTRLNAWQRDVSAALQGRRSSTSFKEASAWRAVMGDDAGIIYAREGTRVATPIGEISAYLAEEIALIERHKPRFCRR